MPTAELAAFLVATLGAQIRAERTLHEGDVTPRLSTWSKHDPVTVFGAGVPLTSAWHDGIERYRASTASGATVENSRRATHVYRREVEGWRIVHRHGDHLRDDQTSS